MTATKWLSRRISIPGPYMTLCLSEQEFLKVIKSLKVKYTSDWVGSGSGNGRVHHFYNNGEYTAVVCISNHEEHSPIEIAGLLVHEATHIWQEWCDSIGERSPGAEQEAYAIQNISQTLMEEFARRMKDKCKN